MNENINLLLLSTSAIYGSGYLGYCSEELKSFFAESKEIIFIPYARPGGISHDEYTAIAAKRFAELGISLRGIHEFEHPARAIESAEGVFAGGGNTFVLLRQLYRFHLVEALRKGINEGLPYMGSSAGSNIAGLTIGTSNDMPIVYPPSFEALGVIPLNINPHYIDAPPNSKHMGETREMRIREFHHFNAQPVVGLREGSWLHLADGRLELGGPLKARLFRKDMEATEIIPGETLNEYLL